DRVWRCPDLSEALGAADRMGPPLGASPPKRMTASWPGALAGSTECKVAARLLRPLRGSPRFVRDTRLSNPAEHSPPPPLWISGPPPPDSWRSPWRAPRPHISQPATEKEATLNKAR